MRSAGRGAEFITYRRWRLRPGVAVQEVVDLVQARIVPHYAALDPTVELELEELEGIDGPGDLIAVQRWPDRGRHDSAMAGTAFEEWWSTYQPLLAAWDRLVEFVAEWETHTLI